LRGANLIQPEAKEDWARGGCAGANIPAARYDTCHGWPHLDVVNGRGELVLKRWMEERDIGEAFQQALLDFKKNHEKYK